MNPNSTASMARQSSSLTDESPKNNTANGSLRLQGDPLPGQLRFGRELRQFDLKSATDEDIISIQRLLSMHGLLVFRDQTLEDHQLIRFSQRVGSGEIEPPAKIFNSPDGNIAYLTNLKKPDGSPLGFAEDTTQVWHADSEFRESGGSLSMLYCLVPAANGGATSFATTAVHNLNIDESELSQLHTLWSTRKAAKVVSHPVVESNASTGAQYLYISENTQDFIGSDGETVDDSEKKKTGLLERILSPKNLYTHQWKQGDLLLYDNMQSVHRREQYQGVRFLKALKFHSDGKYIVAPAGKTLSPLVEGGLV